MFMGTLADLTKDYIPLIAFPIHLAIMFVGLTMLSFVLTGKSVEVKTNLKLALVFLLVYKMLEMYSGQMVTKTGELVKNAPLWNMQLDAIFGWFYIDILGLSGELVYWLTYAVTPIVFIIFIVLLSTKSELKDLIKEVTA